MSKEKAVLDAMRKAGKPVRPGDIAKATGMDSKEVSKIIKELKKQATAQQGMRTDLFQNSEKSFEPIDVTKEIAKRIKVSTDTASRIFLHTANLN